MMVGADEIAALIKKSKATPVRAAGGAASNTTVGAACLGLRTAFVGSCGRDEFADFYRLALTTQGCEPRLLEHAEQPTGRVLSLVTPDGQRTMRTCLGAAAALDPALITPETFQGARLVMLEGYTLFNHDLTRAVARAAKAAGCQLALDLASFEVVNFNRPVLEELLSGQVDLVFANEDEARAWSGGEPEAALTNLAGRTALAVVKLGAKGALIQRGAEVVRVEAEPVSAVIDTTGAGDNWAAGFLAGHLRNLPLAVCGKAAAMAGATAVQVMGAPLPADAWRRIKGYLDAWT
jgi:sugar/nucleoside kinase (ribokinase family)